MMRTFKGPYPYARQLLLDWNSSENGVYYIGVLDSQNALIPLYIGKGAGEGGMRNRLIAHLGRWSNVTHFGYEGGDTILEVGIHEIAEIKKYLPQHNDHHT